MYKLLGSWTALTNQNVAHSTTPGMSRWRSAVHSTYLAIKKNVEEFNGDKNNLSNFYPSQINVFGEFLSSAEQAYHLIKAFRIGNLIADEKTGSENSSK